MTKAHVIVYSRPGCHLCDEAKAVINGAGCTDLFTIEEINIENDSTLLERYRYDIPVIAINGVESFMHRLNADEFKKALSKLTID